MSRADRRQRGTVFVEFLLVFPPLLLLFLGIVQLALMYAASLGVHHAASVATRAAVVIVPDDPVFYEDSPANEIQLVSRCSHSQVAGVVRVLSSGSGGKSGRGGNGRAGACVGGPRMEAIRAAAVMAMVPYAPNPYQLLPVPGGAGEAGWLAGAAIYSMGAVAVNFVSRAGANELLPMPHRFHPGETVTIRTTYLFHCGVPMARLILCDSGRDLVAGTDSPLWSSITNPTSESVRRFERLAKARAGLRELGVGVAERDLFRLLLVSPERFRVLRADASLQLHTAPYRYRSEVGGDRP